jgi:hypothetical protein
MPSAGAGGGDAGPLETWWPQIEAFRHTGTASVSDSACVLPLYHASVARTPPCGTTIEPQFGPLRCFVIGNSDQPNHLVLARAIQAFLRWRNTHNRDPEVIAAQRRERSRVRSERHQRWGRPRPPP